MFSVVGEKPHRLVLHGGEILGAEINGQMQLVGGMEDCGEEPVDPRVAAGGGGGGGADMQEKIEEYEFQKAFWDACQESSRSKRARTSRVVNLEDVVGLGAETGGKVLFSALGPAARVLFGVSQSTRKDSEVLRAFTEARNQDSVFTKFLRRSHGGAAYILREMLKPKEIRALGQATRETRAMELSVRPFPERDRDFYMRILDSKGWFFLNKATVARGGAFRADGNWVYATVREYLNWCVSHGGIALTDDVPWDEMHEDTYDRSQIYHSRHAGYAEYYPKRNLDILLRTLIRSKIMKFRYDYAEETYEKLSEKILNKIIREAGVDVTDRNAMRRVEHRYYMEMRRRRQEELQNFMENLLKYFSS